jgi:uncharacterized membrane protein
MQLASVVTLLHLLGFAAFVGGGFAQQRLMKLSARDGLAAAVRDEYERLSAAILTKVEVPALFAQVVTGVAFIAEAPGFLHQHWLHAKLTAVVLLLVLSHLEMFNARRLVKARQARGDAAKDEIAERKKRHATMGAVGTVLVVAILLLVTVLRVAF